MEGARDGKTVAELMSSGKTILTKDEVMDGVADMLTEVQVKLLSLTGPNLSRFMIRLYN